MRVEQIVPMGRAAGKRLRKALPKTMDLIQSRVERIGSGIESMRSNLRNGANVARKAVRRSSEETAKWVRKNPAALPLIGLGGAALTGFLMMRSRRRARAPKLMERAMKFAKNFPQLRTGFGTVLGRLITWTLTPRKPRVFRAISIRW
jgi:hypothetical protein